jgi:hypothetical protein
VGEPAPAAARDGEVRDPARPERRAEERADCRELARDRGLRQLARPAAGPVGAELGGVGGQGGGVEALEGDVVAAQPGGQLLEVAPVGAPGGVGERLARQEAVDRGAGVHHEQFRLGPRLPAVLLRHRVRDLVLASWETEPERVARVLPAGLEPATVDGRHLVTVAALRWAGGRLGPLPVPRFSQVNVRVYARQAGRSQARDTHPVPGGRVQGSDPGTWPEGTGGGETAVVFLALRVTPLGMGGALLGFPVRPTRARVREGLAVAKGLGVELPYEVGGPAPPSELGEHELGLFQAAGVRAFRVRRGEAAWREAQPLGPVRADPLLALGFPVEGPPELRYAATASFEAELPPRRLDR